VFFVILRTSNGLTDNLKYRTESKTDSMSIYVQYDALYQLSSQFILVGYLFIYHWRILVKY